MVEAVDPKNRSPTSYEADPEIKFILMARDELVVGVIAMAEMGGVDEGVAEGIGGETVGRGKVSVTVGDGIVGGVSLGVSGPLMPITSNIRVTCMITFINYL